MITYTYIVKRPECEDEFFDFFEEAKEFALGCLSKKPVITQTEVNRNDFGECTDHCDLGTVWSWEDMMKETDAEPATSIFTKDDLKLMADGKDPEFDELDNSVDYEPELTEATSPVDATKAPEDSDYVIVLKHPNNNKYYVLGRNYSITSNINKAMTYPGKFSAEDEIKYAVDAAEKRGINFAPKHSAGSDSYYFGMVKIPRTNPEQYYDDYRSANFFVATVAEAKKLLAGEAADSLTEEEQRLATNSKGDYLVRASSGLGYTVFNRSNVAIGGFEEDDDNTAITRFRRGNIKEHVNQENLAIESEQKLDGIDNAVVDCKVAKVISHSEDEKPLNEESAEESCRKPVPEGMSLKDLVEAMEENEDTVECVGCEELFPKDECVHKDGIGWLCSDCEDSVVKCTWCEELFDRSECRREVNLGWLCDRCEAGIKSRGETLTFREGSYWDFLDEKLNLDIDLSGCIDSSDMEIWGVEQVKPGTYDAVLLKRFDNVDFKSFEGPQAVHDEMLDIGGLFVFYFDKNGAPTLDSWNVELLRELGRCEIGFEDLRYETALEAQFNKSVAAAKTESLNEDLELADLVKDSINHLTNDLGKDPWAEDFADEVIGDLERNYGSFVPEDFMKYHEWCSVVASEVSRQVNKKIN